MKTRDRRLRDRLIARLSEPDGAEFVADLFERMKEAREVKQTEKLIKAVCDHLDADNDKQDFAHGLVAGLDDADQTDLLLRAIGEDSLLDYLGEDVLADHLRENGYVVLRFNVSMPHEVRDLAVEIRRLISPDTTRRLAAALS